MFENIANLIKKFSSEAVLMEKFNIQNRMLFAMYVAEWAGSLLIFALWPLCMQAQQDMKSEQI